MNKISFRDNGNIRSLKSSMISNASSFDDVFNKVLNMSETQMIAFIKDFVAQNGIDEVKNVLQDAVSAFSNADIKATAAPLYEGFRPKKVETIRPSKLKQLLRKGSGWLALMTMFLMWAAAGTSDFYNLVEKGSNLSGELKAFLAAFGSAFIAWGLRWISDKIK